MLAATPGASWSSRRARLRNIHSALSASSNSQAAGPPRVPTPAAAWAAGQCGLCGTCPPSILRKRLLARPLSSRGQGTGPLVAARYEALA
jgi:hypothetical protein